MPILKFKGPASEKEDEADKKPQKRVMREMEPADFVFKKELERLKKGKKQHSEKDILKALLDMATNLLSIANASYCEYPVHTNASAVKHLLEQTQQILESLRSLESFEEHAQKINIYVADQYRAVFQAMVGDVLNLQKGIKTTPKPDDLFKEFQRDQAVRFQEAKNKTEAYINKMLESR